MAPKGHSTRPTSDRTRQAIFDVLEHAPWSAGPRGARVLDLFAGSGALGLEALSRGASFCVFLDRDPAALSVIMTNLASLGLRDRGAPRLADASRLGSRPARERQVNLVFLDPPYGGELASQALARLAEGDWLADDATAVVERDGTAGELAPLGPWRALDDRRWGGARVDFLAFRPDRVTRRV